MTIEDKYEELRKFVKVEQISGEWKQSRFKLK